MIHSQAIFDRDPPAQYDGVFLWDFLAGAFGPTIRPMDFDGVIEYRGYFLVFETKNPGVEPPTGQLRAFDALLYESRFTIVFCCKRPAQIRGWTVWTQHGVSEFHGGASALRAWCAAWFEDKKQRPILIPPGRVARSREPGEDDE